LKRLTSKYQTPFGLAIWGFTAPGQAKEILVDSDGHLQVDVLAGTFTVDKVKVWDGTDYLEMDSSGRIGISNFPADYPDSATQSKLDSILTELQQKLETADLLFDASKRLKVTGDSAAPVPVSDAGGTLSVDDGGGSLTVDGSLTATVDKTKIWDGTDYLEMDSSGRIGISNFPADYFKAGQAIGESPFNITKVAGTALTGRDWSDDFAKLDVALSTRASESTLSALNGKVQSQSASLFVKDLSVGTAASQVDADTAYRDEVILLADSANTDTVYVGTSASQTFPLAAGASVAIQKTALNLIYLRAASGTQTVHVISGGA
jgi:hypothetical protein